uniref:Uncharacterized protein n=1 Tax=Arundo donax TaxID=35708 RepID=A0A0A9EUF6_ARUDO
MDLVQVTKFRCLTPIMLSL